MLSAEELDARRDAIESSAELRALRDRLIQRAAPVLTRMPIVPRSKALLTADGGVCPRDGARLIFDPWSPSRHRCPQCGQEYTGERHDRAWAHYQHLWLAERAAHLATVTVTSGSPAAAERANQMLQAYRGYQEYPNRDNVLGPSRLFFSTYLESIWVGNYVAAASLLRDAGMLSDETGEIVSSVADEAANIIGEYDEGFSNRQTWHNAALASIAVWFEDGDLAGRAIEGPTGILAHLLQGFGEDGMWYEGDNYHLFALRGQLVAMGWARQAGVDLLDDPRLTARLAAALRAPGLTALPDFTFPARKDSRFGVSLAQPMYLELWEIGLARLGDRLEQQQDLWSWLRALYQSAAPPAQTFDSYLHEAGEPVPTGPRSRSDLSWWSLLEMAPELPARTPPWSPGSVFAEAQGLAILRSEDRYASLESGAHGGGHGHPDRLNLVLHAGGEYWLPDFGTGSYVARDLFWYRSTLAHNAPRLDGVSQPMGDAFGENFEQGEQWGWARGRYGDLSRTLVAGPDYLLDVVQLSAAQDHLLELPLHLSGQVEVKPAGHWEPAELRDEFARSVERYRSSPAGKTVLHACAASGASLSVHLAYQGDLLRAVAPGAPGSSEPVPFFLIRDQGQNVRIISVFEPGAGQSRVRRVQELDGAIEVETESGVDHHSATVEGWEIRSPDGVTRLRGARREVKPFEPLVRDRPMRAHGVALPLAEAPALDGSMDGFDLSEPLHLDHEDQYRRSEEPYFGPDDFSATVFANWTDEALYLAVEVVKPDVLPRDPAAPPLRLDNEPDEIHADGMQVYLRLSPDDVVHGYLVVPSTQNQELIARGAAGSELRDGEVRGAWELSETGYRMTLAIAPAGWGPFRPGDQISFDLLINQMLPDRLRRAGQLVWSGGGGWVWLRGDRQDPSRFGTLELR